MRTCVIASAVTFLSGDCKVKTSIAVRTCVNPLAGLKGPIRSICIMSPGKLVCPVTVWSGRRMC